MFSSPSQPSQPLPQPRNEKLSPTITATPPTSRPLAELFILIFSNCHFAFQFFPQRPEGERGLATKDEKGMKRNAERETGTIRL